MPGWHVTTHLYNAVTDEAGRFSVEHRLTQRCGGEEIYGVTVAFQSTANQRYYGAASMGSARVRYTWSDKEIDGVIESDPAFVNAPVRIVAFTTRRIC